MAVSGFFGLECLLTTESMFREIRSLLGDKLGAKIDWYLRLSKSEYNFNIEFELDKLFEFKKCLVSLAK